MPKTTETKRKTSSRPVMSPEAYENRLINKAYKAVEKRIDSGEATAAELVHFLRQGSIREQLELEKMKKENELLKAKTESIASQKEVKELYAEAISAFRKYSGVPEMNDNEDEDD
jgi:Rps23 Pro-64 3,4-dihydroxylase Tpa1-like proline 4-hydroxylase